MSLLGGRVKLRCQWIGTRRNRRWWYDSVSENGASFPSRMGLPADSWKARARVSFRSAKESDEGSALIPQQGPRNAVVIRAASIFKSRVVRKASPKLERPVRSPVTGLDSRRVPVSRNLRKGVCPRKTCKCFRSGKESGRGDTEESLSRTRPSRPRNSGAGRATPGGAVAPERAGSSHIPASAKAWRGIFFGDAGGVSVRRQPCGQGPGGVRYG